MLKQPMHGACYIMTFVHRLVSFISQALWYDQLASAGFLATLNKI